MKKIKFKFFSSGDLFKDFDKTSQETKKYLEILVKKAKEFNCLAAMEVNDRIVLAAPDSDPKLLLRDELRSEMNLISSDIIGPYPEPILTELNQSEYDNWFLKNH